LPHSKDINTKLLILSLFEEAVECFVILVRTQLHWARDLERNRLSPEAFSSPARTSRHVQEVNYEGAYYMRTVQFDRKKTIAARLAALAHTYAHVRHTIPELGGTVTAQACTNG